MGKKCTKRRDARAELQCWQRNVQLSVCTCRVVVLVVKLIAVSTFSLPSSLLKLSIL